MKMHLLSLALWAAGTAVARGAAPGVPPAAEAAPPAPGGAAPAAEARADQRYNEMLDRMRAAVEEIAALYGNPTFVQVFTNDPDRADELKRRLRTDQRTVHLDQELKDLQQRRDQLAGDIALKEREATRLSGRLVRQRAALDALAAAVEAARQAVEESSP